MAAEELVSIPEPANLRAQERAPIALQKAYRQRRRKWAWSINRPYSEDLDKPSPGVLDIADEEAG